MDRAKSQNHTMFVKLRKQKIAYEARLRNRERH